jgi:hypothetical protein
LLLVDFLLFRLEGDNAGMKGKLLETETIPPLRPGENRPLATL